MLSAGVKKLGLLLLPFIFIFSTMAQAQESTHVDDTLQVMKAFNQQALENQEAFDMTEQSQHEVLFYMGASLLVLLMATAYFGVNMVVFDKPYFVQHMVCAGFTVTLGMAHAVAAVVWFFPF